jgi:MobA/MobL family
MRQNQQQRQSVAIYHLSVKTISRSAGRSATVAAAYRAGIKITDERTGEIHDYTSKGGVEYTELVLPANAPGWATNRAALWNAAEQAETRKNSTVAREFEIALPSELSYEERQRLAVDFAKEIVARHGCVADVAIHAPGKGGDNRNHHAHILCSTRQLTQAGFTKKTRELDDKKTGEIDRWRKRFAELQNERFQKNGIAASVDHRRLEAQGIDREPTRHLGPAATGYERRTGEPSTKRLDFEREAAERLARAKELGELERQAQALERSIINLSGNLSAAKAERNWQQSLVRQQSQVGLKTPESAVDLVLRQEEKQTPKNPEKLADQIKSGFVEDVRKAWREEEAAREFEKAQGYQQQAKLLRSEEPKKPLLFGVKDWQIAHRVWSGKVANAKNGARYAEKQAKDALEGKLDNDSGQAWAWNKQAQERLEKEHPLIAQAVKEKRLVKPQKATEETGIDKALSDFKSHALNREMKAFGYGETGKKWNALPEGLRTMIEGFKQLPKEARPMALEGMREVWKRKPEVAEKITNQLEQAEEQSRDSGMRH